MPIEFQCPFCSREMKVPDSAAGKSGTCRSCKNKVIVPKQNAVSGSLPPADTSKPKRNKSQVIAWIITGVLILGATCFYVNKKFIGTSVESWSKVDGQFQYLYQDTRSKWSGKITQREMNVFLDETKELLSVRSGQMDELERPHGKWSFVIPLTDSKSSEWYWRGELCTESEFIWRSTHTAP